MKQSIAFLILFIALSTTICAQPFTNINAGLTDVTFSAAAWGDYDNDNDLDLIILGMDAGASYFTKLYRNDGNDLFTVISGLPFTDLAVRSPSFGDYDNDGDLDLLMMGANNSGSGFIRIYENKGNDTFTEVSVVLEQMYDGAVSWCDYNNDGYLDLMYSGFNEVNVSYNTYVYKNNQDGTFTEQTSIDLPGVIKGTIKWADYDNDGDFDFLFTGLDLNSNLMSRVYKNNGDESFTLTEIQMVGVWLGDAAWGDYDMDGDLDILLTGFNFAGRITKIYTNDGNDVFTELQGTPFPGLSHSSAEWGDYDNDGDLDILFCGVDEQAGWIYYTMIYTNNGDNTFTESGISLETVYWGESLWGDYDKDGDLDIILTGYKPSGSVLSAIYRNDISTPNTPPEPPSGLTAVVDENEVSLSWLPAQDNETPSEALSYNCYLYKLNGDTVWSSMSTITTGKRLLTELGNTNFNTSWTINSLEDGLYYWSVQALDNNYEGSAFAGEESFTVGNVDVPNLAAGDLQVYPNPTAGRLFVAVGNTAQLFDLQVNDITGNEVLFFKKWDQNSVDLSELKPGLYFLRFISQEGLVIKKIILQ